MNSITVTPENLIRQAGKVDEEAERYYNEYQSLLADVSALTSTDWKGEDATLFKQKVEDFEPDFNKMKELMQEYAAFLRQAAKNYQDTQSNVKASINSLQS